MGRADSSEAVIAMTSRWRWTEAGLRFMWWMIVLVLGVTILLQEVLLPQWTPPARFQVAVLLALPVALIASWRRYHTRFHTVVIGPEILELESSRQTVKLLPIQVDALLGVSGISFDGGEMIVWKKLVVLTENEHYVIEFDDEMNKACYKRLRRACPRAWCIPFRGELKAPRADSESPEPGVAGSSLTVLRTHFQRQLITSSIVAGVLIAGSLLGFAALMARLSQEPDAAQGLLLLALFFVVGILLARNVVHQYTVLLSLRRAAREPDVS